jgi:hypothetical protein
MISPSRSKIHPRYFVEGISGVLLAGTGDLFAIAVLSAAGQAAWMVIFFVASAPAPVAVAPCQSA